ncbi:MAG: hypothetical protein U1E45_17610 [Geminicoccaceae bacterium]|mgnify:CR=1 FL=1
MDRKLRTKWRMRRWYKSAALAASLIGAAAALLLIVLAMAKFGPDETIGTKSGVLKAIALLAAGIFIPRWVVNAIWRRQKNLHWEEWE